MKTLNPARGWHHISTRDPKKFQIVATIQLGHRADETNRADSGIQARIGREKGKPKSKTKFVTLLFDPRIFTLEMAKDWAASHGEKVREAVEAPEKPEYPLSDRARAIGRSRHEGAAKSGYRAAILKHGVGVVLDRIETYFFPQILRQEKAGDLALSPESVRALTCGFFLTGRDEKSMLVLPPSKGLISKVAGELSAVQAHGVTDRREVAVAVSKKLSALVK